MKIRERVRKRLSVKESFRKGSGTPIPSNGVMGESSVGRETVTSTEVMILIYYYTRVDKPVTDGYK